LDAARIGARIVTPVVYEYLVCRIRSPMCGREGLVVSNILIAAGLVTLAMTHSQTVLQRVERVMRGKPASVLRERP